MSEPTDSELRAAGAQLHVDQLRADFEAQLSDQALAVWQLAGAIAPHGDFTIHVSDSTRGPNNELAVYVICECGRGYSWERKMPGRELLVWLANHGPDIPLDEEERCVKAATSEEPAS